MEESHGTTRKPWRAQSTTVVRNHLDQVLLGPKGSSGEGARRYSVNGIDIGNQVKGKQQTHLFSNGETLIYSPSTRPASQSGDIV